VIAVFGLAVLLGISPVLSATPSGSGSGSDVRTFSTDYTVTFVASGLPTGTAWNVALNGATHYSNGSRLIKFEEPTGGYGFVVGSIRGYTAAPNVGNLSVIGSAVNESIVFSRNGPEHSVTFVEHGLASGTSWAVTLNGIAKSSNGSSPIQFEEANGTYGFTVGTVHGYTADPAIGNVTVKGASLTEKVEFTRTVFEHAVTFTETGLPAGTSWAVTLHGVKKGSNGSSPIRFEESKGTYAFHVGSVLGFTASPREGNITVKGTSVSEKITFTATNGSVPAAGVIAPSATAANDATFDAVVLGLVGLVGAVGVGLVLLRRAA
jgi:hypothetical protein